MTKFVNLTPHTINVVTPSGVTTFPTSGQVARVKTTDVVVAVVEGIELFTTEYGQVEGLPEAEEGVYLIVSGLVRAAVPHRKDVVSPGQLVRDDAGQPVGCKGFTTNGTPQ